MGNRGGLITWGPDSGIATGPGDDQFLVWNAAKNQWVPSKQPEINDLPEELSPSRLATVAIVQDGEERRAVIDDVSRDAIFASRWDDLRFPVGGLNPPGPIGAPEIDDETGLLNFNDSVTRVVAGVAQMPHAWTEGSTIVPHIHWIRRDAGDVLWRLEYRIMPAVNADFPAEWTVIDQTTTTHAYPGSGDRLSITSFGDVDMTGFLISAQIVFRLSRIGGDASDTHAAVATLIEFDIHYQKDAAGSVATFTK